MSLYQRGKSWYSDFQYRRERYTGCIGPVSRTVAKEILAKKKAEAVEGRYELPSKKPSPRLDEFVQEYLAYVRASRRPRTAERYETAYNTLRLAFGGQRLADISAFAIEAYKRRRKEAGVSEATINCELAFLKSMFTKAIAWGKTAANPVKNVRPYRLHNARTRFLTVEEEARLLAQCGSQLKPLVITALHTGLRKSELLSLTWEQVDFERRIVTVQAAYAKNGEARSVPMNKVLAATLTAVRRQGTDAVWVFCNRHGSCYRSYHNAFTTAVRRAGLVEVRFHDLRHTFASRLVMAGVDLTTVKELLGHKDIAMTLRYAHLSQDHKQAAVRTLEKVPPIFTTAPTASLAG